VARSVAAPGDVTERDLPNEWVQAVNAHGSFGQWRWDVSRDPKDVAGILAQHDVA
jgi:type III restriction enzyme